MFLNIDVGENAWESLGLQGDQTARKSILKEINPEYSLQGLMLKLKLQYFASDVKNWLIGKDLDAGKDWRWEKKGTTEVEIVGWQHWLDGHGFEQARELVIAREAWHAACSPWGCKQSHEASGLITMRTPGKSPHITHTLKEDEMVGWHHWLKWTWT